MAREVSSEAAKKATGRDWDEWKAHLDAAGAAEMPHKELAAWIGANEPGVSMWWAQMVTVEYERMIGRRKLAQTCAGDFQTQASKTLPGSMDDWLERWSDIMADLPAIDGVLLDEPPKTSSSEKWRYWRAALADGSRIAVTIGQKDTGKVTLAVGHTKLEDEEQVVRWKAYWKAHLAELVA
ncbi:MAG: hypothetical protein ACPGQL_01080 [Thermoplasmatota archaeon]